LEKVEKDVVEINVDKVIKRVVVVGEGDTFPLVANQLSCAWWEKEGERARNCTGQ